MPRYLVCHLTPSELGDILVQSCGLAKFWVQNGEKTIFSGLGKKPTFPSDFPQISPAEPPQTAPGSKITFFNGSHFKKLLTNFIWTVLHYYLELGVEI